MKQSLFSFLIGLVLIPILALIALGLGFWPTKATDSPPGWEKYLGQSAVHASVTRRAPKIKNPLPASDETILAGIKAFRNNCAGCHGEPGHPSLWGTTAFYPRVPQFAETPSRLSEGEMFFVFKNGIRYSGMGGWGTLLSDSEIWQMVTFLSRIKSLPSPAAEAWTKP